MNNTINTLKVLSDPVRLRIVSLLSMRESCVCDIESVLGMSQSRISNHLAKLKAANMISDRQEGKWKYYSLTKESTTFLKIPLLKTLDDLKKSDPLKNDLKKLKKNNRC